MTGDSIPPIKKSVIAEEISTQLLEMIRDKRLQPGQKLPPERELASQLNVSRPSLREALRALSIMNIIEVRQGDGTYVSSLEPEKLVEHLDFVFDLDDSTFLELIQARKIVESGIAALAAQRITPQEISLLEELQERSKKTVDDMASFLDVDLQLHAIITGAAGNPFLERFQSSISRLSLASRSRTAAIDSVRRQTVKDHQNIISALKMRDSEKASRAMLEHLSNVEAGLRKMDKSEINT
jgi:GntR family transcriptional repressor for pyruvate dehydrogenase complex